MSYEEPIEILENDVLAVGVTGLDGSYVMWQKGLTEAVGSEDGIYFEIDDQSNGGYNIVKECTVTNDGIHLVLVSGKLEHFYFPPDFNKVTELQESLEKIYQGSEHVLEFSI